MLSDSRALAATMAATNSSTRLERIALRVFQVGKYYSQIEGRILVFWETAINSGPPGCATILADLIARHGLSEFHDFTNQCRHLLGLVIKYRAPKLIQSQTHDGQSYHLAQAWENSRGIRYDFRTADSFEQFMRFSKLDGDEPLSQAELVEIAKGSVFA